MMRIELYDIASTFRQAIVKTKKHGAFNYMDRMNCFPDGCCDDTANLFAHYLYHEHGILSVRIDASYHDGNPERNTGHSWQEVDGMVVDLTGSQTQFRNDPIFLNYSHDVYVGPMDDFHRLFEENRREYMRGIEDLGNSSWYRMYGLYTTIMKNMKC